MSRNRSNNDRSIKQTSISSISSKVPLMASAEDHDHSILSAASAASANIQSILDSMKLNTNRETKRTRSICQPKGTIVYTVGLSDTLEKIALNFNSTPSEILHLNKLNTRIVFPGQILYVPDGSVNEQSESLPTQAQPTLPTSTIKSKENDPFILLTDHRLTSESSSPPSTYQHDQGQLSWSMNRPAAAAKPGRAQRLKSEASVESDSSTRTIEDRLKTQKEDNTRQVQQIHKSLSIEESRKLDEECLQRFIKVHVRLMTEDHVSVAGTLLVTPNAVMFDPDVLDPMVKEHGIEKYGLIIQMNFLAGIALYEDIAMYEHEATLRDEGKRRMVQSSSIKNIHSFVESSVKKDEEQIKDLMHSIIDEIEKTCGESETPLILFDVSSLNYQKTRLASASDDVFSNFDANKHSSTILVDEKISSEDLHRGFQLENCIPVNDLNKRFGEIDKLLQKQHDLYVTPHPIEIPYYLCVKTSRRAQEQGAATSRVTDDVYGKKRLDTEYWFSVPKEKVDHLYAFFLRWSPDRDSPQSSSKTEQQMNKNVTTNQVNHSSSQTQIKNKENPTNKGFVLFSTDDTQSIDDYLSTETNTRARSSTNGSNKDEKKSHYLKRQNTLLKEWEIINVDEIYRRINAAQANSAHLEDVYSIPAPKLSQPSTIINEIQSKEILLQLPARVSGLNWQLLFSTEQNGFSLNQLYRRSLDVDLAEPALLIVKDVGQNIFGAYVSQQFMVSEGFYGTGESFLYTFHPHFQAFKWTGNNQFFVKGDTKSVGIGCGEGIFGLWLDADLYHGRTCPSKTFNNLCLSSNEDFIIASVEVWTFVD